LLEKEWLVSGFEAFAKVLRRFYIFCTVFSQDSQMKMRESTGNGNH
jgi:hypothetical protein